MRAEWFTVGAAAAEHGEAGGSPADVAAKVRSLVAAGASVAPAVAQILARVREDGDAAVLDYTRRFDTKGAEPPPLRVPPDELQEALALLPGDVREGIELARTNVGAVARAGVDEERDVQLEQGHSVRLREVPVRRAAIYVPGGRAPYPSTVVMGVETAKAAGVDEIVVVAPPGPSGAHPVILAACALCGADEVYRMGGVQAIGALAYGTESVAPVDVIAGPGNLYVQEAKRQVLGLVGIDGFAGPSDLVVLAADGADPALVALDLLAQGEHGEDSLVVVVSVSDAFLDDVGVEIGSRLKARPSVLRAQCALVHAASLEEGLQFCEALAPEHFQLVGAEAEALAPRVRNAGCLFVGSFSGTAFGDYVAGSNHTLPTEGAARFSSGLNVRHFRRRMAEVRIDRAAASALAPLGDAIARAESFPVHGESMTARAAAAER